jgi:steroid delta-isomerase-like uncharacterized protein
MSTEQNKTIVRRYFEAYDTDDLAAVMAFVHPSHTHHPPGGAESMDYEARKESDGVFFAGFSNIRTIVEDQIAEGSKVASRITMHCTHTGEFHGMPATGKRIAITFIDIARIKDGKIVEEWTEYDMGTILRLLKE